MAGENSTVAVPFTTVTPGLTTSPNASDVFVRYSFTEFMELFCPTALLVDRAITVMWYVVGIAGNLVSAKIWLERRMRQNNSSAVYLATLSISDMLFLVLHILQELIYAWGKQTLSVAGVCEGYFLLYTVVQYLSPILVLGFTVERYIAVCHPFEKERFCTQHRAVKVVLGLIALCLALSCIQSYFWTYDGQQCKVRDSAWQDGGDHSLWSVWSWTTELLIFFVVPMIILVFNILVIREVKRVSRSESLYTPGQASNHSSSVAATTVMLLSVAFYVILTTIPATLVYVLIYAYQEGDRMMTDDQIRNDPVWQSYLSFLTVKKFVEEVCISHYACNVFLYLITGPQFRTAFIQTFQCLRCSRTGDKYLGIPKKNNRTSWNSTLTTKV